VIYGSMETDGISDMILYFFPPFFCPFSDLLAVLCHVRVFRILLLIFQRDGFPAV
jgi:hypothetical protein